MSQPKPFNQAILDDLNKDSFLGKLFTTTEEEMLACVRNEFPAPDEKQVAAGPLGALNKFETALLTQLTNANAAAKKAATDFMKEEDSSEPKEVDLLELLSKGGEAIAGAIQHKKFATGYRNLLNEALHNRISALKEAENGYSICNDGNIYAAPEEDHSCIFCSGSKGFGAVIEVVLGGSRDSSKSAAQA